ncbi:MAG: hypothetical protein IMY72_06880 [Bacteroidetes bacterium]|nr:hypothetical protein [Bacteroidota bacterium]
MKKVLLSLLLGLLIFSGCKKDDDDPSPSFDGMTIKCANVSSSNIKFDWDATTDQTVTFDAKLSDIAPLDATITIAEDASSTAISGTHFTLASPTLTIAKGATSVSSSITILADGLNPEETKTIVLDLSSDKIKVGAPAQITIAIEKNKKPVISFDGMTIKFANISSSSIKFDWDATTDQTVTFDAELSDIAPLDGTITIAENASSTAVSGTHFTLESPTLTIAKGTNSVNSSITILANGLNPEETKIIVLDLNSDQITIGAPAQITITIEKDKKPEPVNSITQIKCTPTADWGAYSCIKRFQLKDIDNESTADGYDEIDFTSMSATVIPGELVDFTVTLGSCESTPPQDDLILAVWVDWNGDGDLSDDGEKVFRETISQGDGTFVKTFTVPNTATAGTFVLRVAEWFKATGGLVDGCGKMDSGEAEDYAIIIN